MARGLVARMICWFQEETVPLKMPTTASVERARSDVRSKLLMFDIFREVTYEEFMRKKDMKNAPIYRADPFIEYSMEVYEDKQESLKDLEDAAQ